MKKKILSQPDRFIKVILAITGILFLGYLLVIPPLQIPDEPAHLRYVQYIAEEGWVPPKSVVINGKLLNDAPDIAKLVQESQAGWLIGNPNQHYLFNQDGGPELQNQKLYYIFNHPPFYYVYMAIPYLLAGSVLLSFKLFVLKITNIVFVLLNVYFAYKFGKKITGESWHGVAIAALAGLWPMYLFLSAGINNDIAVVCAATASFYYLLSFLRENSKFNAVGLGLWVAVGALTKVQFLLILPPILLVLLYKIWEERKSVKWGVWAAMLLFPLGAVLFYLSQLVRLGRFFASPRVSEISTEIVTSCTDKPMLQYLKVLISPRLVLVVQSYVGNFGWLDTKLPREVVIAFMLVLLFSIIFAIVVFLRRFKKKGSNRSIQDRFLLIFVAGGIITELFFIFLYMREYLSRCYIYFPTQGRYYFALLLPVAYIVMYGLTKGFESKRGILIAKIVFIVMLLFNSYVLQELIVRYYL